MTFELKEGKVRREERQPGLGSQDTRIWQMLQWLLQGRIARERRNHAEAEFTWELTSGTHL